jgi:hypothetical protein
MFRLFNLRLRFLQRGLQVSRIHAGDHLPSADGAAFVDKKLGHAAGELGGDIDFIGLDAAVSRHDSNWQCRIRVLEPVPADSRSYRKNQEQKSNSAPSARRSGPPKRYWRLARRRRHNLLRRRAGFFNGTFARRPGAFLDLLVGHRTNCLLTLDLKTGPQLKMRENAGIVLILLKSFMQRTVLTVPRAPKPPAVAAVRSGNNHDHAGREARNLL